MKKTPSYFLQVFILIILFFTLVSPVQLNAQDTDSTATAETVQKFIVNNTKAGARSTALGNTSVADYQELSSIYINPAALSFIKNLKRVEFNSSQSWDRNLMLQNLTVPFLAYNKHRITLQTGILHKGLDLGNSSVPELTANPSLILYRFDLAYAYSFTPTISMGFINSTSIAHKAQFNQTTNSVSVGMLYAPSKSVSYGVAFRGLGRDIGYKITESGETELITRNRTETVELGATLNYPVDTDKTYLSLSIANEKRFGDPGIRYKLGLEVKLNSTSTSTLPDLQLRSGIIMQPEFDVYAPTFGVGTDFKTYSINFAISPGTQLNERFFQLGFIVYFDKI